MKLQRIEDDGQSADIDIKILFASGSPYGHILFTKNGEKKTVPFNSIFELRPKLKELLGMGNEEVDMILADMGIRPSTN